MDTVKWASLERGSMPQGEPRILGGVFAERVLATMFPRPLVLLVQRKKRTCSGSHMSLDLESCRP